MIEIPPYPNPVVFLPALVTLVALCAMIVVSWFTTRGKDGVFTPLALAGYGLALAATVWLALTFRERPVAEFSGAFRLDDFSLFVTAATLVAALFATAVAVPYLPLRGLGLAEYHILLACAVLGGVLVAASVDLIALFLAVELISIPVYVLTGYAKADRASNEASLKYFLLGAFASAILLYGMAFAFGLTGSTNLYAIADTIRAAPAGSPLATGPLLTVAILLLIAGFGFKAAVAPFHMWTPDAYQGAPTPVAAFLSTAPKIAAVAALARVLVAGFPLRAEEWTATLAVLAVLTMTIGNVTALVQRSVKRMLAYSSIAHTGYMLVGLAAWSAPAAGATIESANLPVGGVMFYLATYLFLNVGAFGLIAWYENHGGGELYEDMAGLARTAPAAALAMGVMMLGLTGVPPTSGFLGKYYLFSAAVNSGLAWLAVVGVLNSAVSAYFYLGVIVQMYMREPRLAIASPRSPLMAAALGLCALVSLLLFLGPLQNALYAWSLLAGAP